jgi:ABC-type antimicrobial peptide transport system permease subunit
LGVLAAAAGLLLAALVLVLLVASTWRRRSRDLACLGLTGVPRRGLSRVAVGEQLPVVLLAVLVGAGCGLLGAVLALPTVPLFAQPRDASTLELSAPWGSVLAVLVAALLVLGLVAWLCGRTVAARARLSRVREVL